MATIVASALVAVVPTAAFTTRVIDPAPPPLSPPLVGFSFSPAALPAGAIPEEARLKRAEFFKKVATQARTDLA